jgi:phosphatidylglycerol:prolipoprotein diacylglycerol transferase
MIAFPNVSPEIFSIDFLGFKLSIRWYALSYIAGFLAASLLMKHFVKKKLVWRFKIPPMDTEASDRMLTYLILGVILGGRVGYVFFYNFEYYTEHPGDIIRVWDGGMSFHGGFLGVAVAGIIFCYLNAVNILSAADLVSLATPPGLFFGRLANFVNAELWGSPTDLPWGVVFPGSRAQDCPDVIGICARHPTQIYEAFLEGLLLLIILLFITAVGALKKPGLVTGTFIGGYGVARFVVEYFRIPDPQFFSDGNNFGYAYQLGEFGITMGQVLSIPMVCFGIFLITFSLIKFRSF